MFIKAPLTCHIFSIIFLLTYQLDHLGMFFVYYQCAVCSTSSFHTHETSCLFRSFVNAELVILITNVSSPAEVTSSVRRLLSTRPKWSRRLLPFSRWKTRLAILRRSVWLFCDTVSVRLNRLLIPPTHTAVNRGSPVLVLLTFNLVYPTSWAAVRIVIADTMRLNILAESWK